MIGQAAGFALLASVSPTSLLVMAVFLGSSNPRRTAMYYVAGAILMTVIMAVTLLVVIRVAGLDMPSERTPRYWFRFALGVLALASGLVIIYRARRAKARPAEVALAKEAEARSQGMISRLTASPSPRTAFLAGLLLFAPSATFIAAVQVVATARAAVPVTAVALILVTVLSVLVVWLPLLTYLIAPDATTRNLRMMNAWLRANALMLGSGALVVVGVWLIVNGLLGALTR